MTPISQLKELAFAYSRSRFPSLPEYARTIHKYQDRTANGLTRCIIDFLKFEGWQAERISTTGRYLDKSKIVTDVLGRARRIGSGKWIPGSMTAGSADISAVIAGRAIKIEVKIKDKQSEAQKNYQKEVTRAGGVYIIIKSFVEFYSWYKNFMTNE